MNGDCISHASMHFPKKDCSQAWLLWRRRGMECLVGHGAVSLGVGGVERRLGGSNAVATNKECLVAVGGGRRRNQNCGAGVSSVSPRVTALCRNLQLPNLIVRSWEGPDYPRCLYDCSLQLSSGDLEGVDSRCGHWVRSSVAKYTVVVEFAILSSVFHLYPLVIKIASRCLGKNKLQAYVSLINKRRLSVR